jgi:DNA repair protein RecN
MLKSLYIQNFVLIDNLDILFDNGFSVISGETGAGKSIILGALSLVLGQRSDSKSIKQGMDKCVIEATFDISEYNLKEYFETNELEFDSEACIFRRELFASGKSRAFLNDSPVSLAIIKDLGAHLIDIHSQHQNLLLGDTAFQLRVIDIMADNKPLLQEYHTSYTAYTKQKKELKDLKEKAVQVKQEEDYIRFQSEQLSEAKLIEDEQDSLEQEQEILSHAEEIKSALYKISNLLNGEDGGALPLLKEALAQSSSLTRYYNKAKEIEERLRSAYIDLNDLAGETDSQKEEVEFNPERMEWVNDRLNTIYTLEQKHHVDSVKELIAIQEEYQRQLQDIDSFDEQIADMENVLKKSYTELVGKAEVIRKQRKKAALEVDKALIATVSQLGMPNARFKVEFTDKKEPDANGMDDVRFMFSANKSGDLQPVEQTASGGEISRLMLCLKAMIAGSTALPSIIFDEVDTGVSGDIADKMGEIMRELGAKMQVLTITHLPQIAAKGNEHYFVYKEDLEEQTVTHLRKLTNDERVTEIARMLSGATLTDASIANAKDLLGFK